MRTIIIAIFVFGIFGCGSSQPATTDFSDFYNDHEDDAGIVSFSFPIGLAKAFLDDDDKDAKKAFDKIHKMRFFICEKDHGFYSKKIQNYLPEGTYHDLMVVKDGKETVTFKMKAPVNNKIKEILLIVSEPDSFVAISFMGNFTIDEAKEMASSIKTDNLGSVRL
jgi:hypothetical protein